MKWLSTNAATASSTDWAASGSARISATAPGGRVAASQASMPKDRSTAMALAGSQGPAGRPGAGSGVEHRVVG